MISLVGDIEITAYADGSGFDQHAVGKGFCIGGDAEERAESSVAGFAAVEAKDELIEIGPADACDAARGRRLAPIL